MADQPSPTLRRRELGNRLRELRQGLNLTLDEVAERLTCSISKISRMESGARGVAAGDLRGLCSIYDVADGEREHLLALARQSRDRAWWQEYDLPVTTYIGLEQSAVSLSEYSDNVIPGLLQTPEYVAALVEGMEPKLDAEQSRQRLDMKSARQQVLHQDDAPELWVVIDEAALHRVVGSALVMAGQLDALLSAAQQPRIHIQVMPFEAGAHPGLNSNFVIIQLGRRDQSDVIFVEGLVGKHYLERQADLDRYKRVFDQLRAVALSPKRSTQLMAELRARFPSRQDTRG